MNVFRRQLIFLTNDHLTAYPWEKGEYSKGLEFTNDEAGQEAFSRHLAASKDTPIYLLADLVEEDFQRDNLPHVLGKSRQALIQRRLGQIYRETPYRQTIQQGREAQGRKDDRLLFSALTNVDLLNPWLNAIQAQQAPLTGIYSPALMSAELIRKLDLASAHLLLVTHQSSGLRQSYFQGTDLKFSRLTPLVDHNPDTVADTTARESANTRQFLLSTRLLPRDETLDNIVLAHHDYLPQLQAACRNTSAATYRFVDLADAAARLGLKNTAVLCDSLFLFLLGHASPARHYAQAEQTRFYRLRQVRLVCHILSAGLVASALLPAVSNSLEALRYYRQGRQMSLEASAVKAEYQAIIHSLPPTVIPPENMKAAVNIERMLSRQAPEPARLLGMVSHALDTLPQIRIDQLQWQVRTKNENAGDAAGSLPPRSMPVPGIEEQPSGALIGIPEKPLQILLIEGEIVALKQSYRTARESLYQFVAGLDTNPQLKTEITKSPLDIAPSAKLSGKADEEDAESKARFSLKLILSPER